MQEPAKMQQIGFIGLGRMGSPMASNLCKKGFELLVYDVNPKALAAFEQPHSKAARALGFTS